MAALVGVRRFKAIRDLLLTGLRRQTGNSYGAGACAAAVHSARLPLNLGTRSHLLRLGAQPRPRLTDVDDATAEVHDYSGLVSVVREGGKTSSYNAVWLRENCRCDACFVALTAQRAVVFHRLPPEAFVASCVTWVGEEGVVEVTWDDGHLSRYTSQLLMSQLFVYSPIRLGWCSMQGLCPIYTTNADATQLSS